MTTGDPDGGERRAKTKPFVVEEFINTPELRVLYDQEKAKLEREDYEAIRARVTARFAKTLAYLAKH